MDKRDESKKARESFSRSRSDLLTDVAAFDACNELRSKGGTHGAVRQFCESVRIRVDLLLMRQNFISATTIRDVTSLRQDFLSALSSIGFLASTSPASLARFNTNSTNDNLIKAIIVGGLYPRVARIALPNAQFERIEGGSVQKDHQAKEVKFFDQAGRVFLHPSSVLFAETGLKSGFVTYFSKAETSKVFLRDATEVYLLSSVHGHPADL
jgi:ATP-dependent RNA helicase DHX57